MAQPQVRAKKIDWEGIKQAFIEGDRDLYSYSRETTGLDDHPTYSTLRSRSYNESWQRSRDARIRSEAVEAIGKDKALQSEVVQVEVLARDELLNANNAIFRQVKLSQDIQKLVEGILPKFQEALQYLDLNQLAVDNPRGFLSAMKTVTELYSTASEIERKVMGAADIKIELSVNQPGGQTMQDKIAALKEMPQEELIRSYMDVLKSAS